MKKIYCLLIILTMGGAFAARGKDPMCDVQVCGNTSLSCQWSRKAGSSSLSELQSDIPKGKQITRIFCSK